MNSDFASLVFLLLILTCDNTVRGKLPNYMCYTHTHMHVHTVIIKRNPISVYFILKKGVGEFQGGREEARNSLLQGRELDMQGG